MGNYSEKQTIYDLIYKKSLPDIKIMIKKSGGEVMSNIIEFRSSDLKKYFEKSDYLDFCNRWGLEPDDKNYSPQSLLIFVYLFGNPEILEFFLKSNMINLIKNNHLFLIQHDESQNLIEFISYMDNKNQWNMKSEVYKKVYRKYLFKLIKNDELDLVEEILSNYVLSLLDVNIKAKFADMVCNDNEINLEKRKLFGKIYVINKNITIKIALYYMTKLFGSKEMYKLVFELLKYSNSDLSAINRINLDFFIDQKLKF
jgi:hypothetical protein